MVRYRRVIAIAIFCLAAICGGIALLDESGLADVPRGTLFASASWLLIGGAWIFLDMSRRWLTPDVTEAKR